MKNTIIFLLLLSLTSCSVVNKVFHKHKSTTDSTSVVHEKKDSTGNIDSSSFHKEEKQTWWKNDSAKEKENTVITEVTIKEKFDSSGKLTERKTYKKKTENNKQKESFSAELFDKSGRIDSNELKKAAKESSQTENKTNVTKKEKKVTQDVSKKKFLWLLLLLIPAYIIYRNWPKIKQLYFFIKTFFI